MGEWNAYEFTVDPPDFTVVLNGRMVNQFHFTGDPQSSQRSLASDAAAAALHRLADAYRTGVVPSHSMEHTTTQGLHLPSNQ